MKKKSYTIVDFYEHYLSNIDRDTLYDVEYKVYRNVIEDYFKHIVEEVLENSKEFKLPCRLGNLSIVKKQPKNFDTNSLRIDYHESALQGKAVYFLNEHSSFFKFRYFWSKKDSLLKNKTKYQFVASRHNKRRLALIIKNREHDYVEIR